MRPTAGSVCVCLLLLLAGCNAPADSGGTLTAPETTTPAPVPEAETFAPGVTEAGVVSPSTLARAHVDTIEDRSYTLVANRTERYANGSNRSVLHIRVGLTADRSYLVNVETAGPDGPVFLGEPPAEAAFWSNGSVYVRRLTRGNSTVYNEFRPLDDGAGTWNYWAWTVAFGGGQATPESFYRKVFRGVGVTSVERDRRNGTAVVHLQGNQLRSEAFTDEFDEVRNVTLTATVTERGLVKSLSLQFTGTVDNATVHVKWRVRYRKVETTTVERPPWFERAVK